MKALLYSLLFYCSMTILMAQPNTGGKTVDGKREGFWTIYDSNKQFLGQGNYKDNLREGEWKFYISAQARKQRKPDVVGSYNKGVKVGIWRCIDLRSLVIMEGSFQQDKMEGEWRFLDKNRKLLATGLFKNGIREGGWTLYQLNVPFLSGRYKDGRKSGTWKHTQYGPDSLYRVVYDLEYGTAGANGHVTIYRKFIKPGFKTEEVITGAGNFVNGKKQDKWVEYEIIEAGESLARGLYENDLKTGLWRFDLNGKLYEEVNYVKGVRHGAATVYHPNGQKQMELSYQEGLPNGPFKVWYPTGQLKEEGSFSISGTPQVDTLYQTVELPIEFRFEFVDEGLGNVSPRSIRWSSKPDFEISASQYQSTLSKLRGLSPEPVIQEITRDKFSAKSGPYKSYHPDGQIESEGTYTNAPIKVIDPVTKEPIWEFSKDGDWKFYDQSATLRKTITYAKGRQVKETKH